MKAITADSPMRRYTFVIRLPILFFGTLDTGNYFLFYYSAELAWIYGIEMPAG